MFTKLAYEKHWSRGRNEYNGCLYSRSCNVVSSQFLIQHIPIKEFLTNRHFEWSFKFMLYSNIKNSLHYFKWTKVYGYKPKFFLSGDYSINMTYTVKKDYILNRKRALHPFQVLLNKRKKKLQIDKRTLNV